MQKSKQLLKFEKEVTLSVKIAFSQLRRAGLNNASYAKVQEMVRDLVFAEKDDWIVISTITAFKKRSIEEQVLMKLPRPEIAVAKKWDGKK